MNWEQFSYLCRVNSSVKLTKTDKLTLSAGANLNIYHSDGNDSQLAQMLAKNVISQDEVAAQKSAIYYQCISDLLTELKFEYTGWLVYLTCVFVFFCLSSSLYQFFVVPAFVDMYSMHQYPANHTFDSYFRYWYVPIIVLFVLLGAIVSVSTKLKSACLLNELKPFTGLSSLLSPRQLIKNYEAITAILLFPLNSSLNIGATTTETEHLNECEKLGLDARSEFNVLLKQHLKQFNQRVKNFINKLIIIYGVVIALSIYLFVNAAYHPLFMLGDVL